MIASYLLEKTAKLQRERASLKEYVANYQLLNPEKSKTLNRRERRSTYSKLICEMIDRD